MGCSGSTKKSGTHLAHRMFIHIPHDIGIPHQLEKYDAQIADLERALEYWEIKGYDAESKKTRDELRKWRADRKELLDSVPQGPSIGCVKLCYDGNDQLTYASKVRSKCREQCKEYFSVKRGGSGWILARHFKACYQCKGPNQNWDNFFVNKTISTRKSDKLRTPSTYDWKSPILVFGRGAFFVGYFGNEACELSEPNDVRLFQVVNVEVDDIWRDTTITCRFWIVNQNSNTLEETGNEIQITFGPYNFKDSLKKHRFIQMRTTKFSGKPGVFETIQGCKTIFKQLDQERREKMEQIEQKHHWVKEKLRLKEEEALEKEKRKRFKMWMNNRGQPAIKENSIQVHEMEVVYDPIKEKDHDSSPERGCAVEEASPDSLEEASPDSVFSDDDREALQFLEKIEVTSI